jgi:hypothetical protein
MLVFPLKLNRANRVASIFRLLGIKIAVGPAHHTRGCLGSGFKVLLHISSYRQSTRMVEKAKAEIRLAVGTIASFCSVNMNSSHSTEYANGQSIRGSDFSSYSGLYAHSELIGSSGLGGAHRGKPPGDSGSSANGEMQTEESYKFHIIRCSRQRWAVRDHGSRKDRRQASA